MTREQKNAVMDLLWDSLKRDPKHSNRRQTGWGTKTKVGLCACIERIGKGVSLLNLDSSEEADLAEQLRKFRPG